MWAGTFELALERGERLREQAASERLARSLRGHKEVVTMETSSLSDETLRTWARQRVEMGRRLKLRAAVFMLGMLVLTPVWAVSEYLSSGGWPQRLSGNDSSGDWSPWIIWVALVWGFYVAATALVVHFRRPVDEQEVDRELAHLVGRARISGVHHA